MLPSKRLPVAPGRAAGYYVQAHDMYHCRSSWYSLSHFYFILALLLATSTQPTMDGDSLSLWERKWDANQTGWHKVEINHVLNKHGDKIIPAWHPIHDHDRTLHVNDSCSSADRDDVHCKSCGGNHPPLPVDVFVPLCGKSLDMKYLAQHSGVAEVVGIDGISKAIEEFSAENPGLQLKAPISNGDIDMDVWSGDSIKLIRGDYFALDQTKAGRRFDAVFDRASLVAIEPSKRGEYVDIMGELVQHGGKILLVTIEKREGDDEACQAGPPYSISETDVRKLYEGQDWVESVEMLDEYDEFHLDRGGADRWRKKGVSAMYELAFLVTAKK